MKSVTWTPDMIAALMQLRTEQHMPLHYCAEKIGVSYKIVVLKAHELGVADRYNHGSKQGWKRSLPPPRGRA